MQLGVTVTEGSSTLQRRSWICVFLVSKRIRWVTYPSQENLRENLAGVSLVSERGSSIFVSVIRVGRKAFLIVLVLVKCFDVWTS